jgi:hypothetical protein
VHTGTISAVDEPVAEEAEEVPEAPKRRLLRSLATLSALGLAIAAIAAFGGLKAVPNGPQQLGPAAKVNQGRFTVTFVSAGIALVNGDFGQPAKRSLVVRLKVANNGTDTAYLDGGLTNGIAGEPKPGTYLDVATITGSSGGGKTGLIQPGLPVDVELAWTLGPATTPRKMTVALWLWKYDVGFSDQKYNWTVEKKGTSPMAEVTVPVAAS